MIIQRLLYEKNFQDKIDSMKKLTNIWSSRGLSVYGKVAIIKSHLISKLVYTSSSLLTPSHVIKKVNHIIYNFLWNGKDKVTRLSAIDNYEAGGVKMIDIDSLIKALRLAWSKQIFMVMVMVMNLYTCSAFSIIIFKCALLARDLWVRSNISI